MLEPFTLPYFQRGVAELLLLAIPAGILGTWIVLRRLAFFSHALGTAAFPGLVLADGLGFAAPLGAFGAALAFTGATVALRGRRERGDAVVALVLAGCLAAGVVLASDVFASGANVETLLFGSLLLVDGRDLALAAAAGAATLAAAALLGRHWLRIGFDPARAAAGSPRPLPFDAALLLVLAFAVTAALTVVGALLVTALFLVPAVTARLLAKRLRTWQLLSVALVAIEGTIGLWLSVRTDAPPGATIACVAGATFAATAAARALGSVAPPAAAAGALLAVVVAGFALGGGAASADGRLEVVATTTQLGDFAREVGGGDVAVEQILEPNTDPHTYEPRPSDVEAAANAKLILASGDDLDSWARELDSDSGGRARLIDLGSSVPVRLAADAEGSSGIDPHWWHDPRNAEAAVRRIAAAFAAADPAHASDYRRNATDYLRRLRALDAEISRCIGTIPPQRRKLVTDHGAFGYFANRYGLEIVGALIPSQATEAQPSAADLSDLIGTIDAERVRAIFPEASLSPKVAETIAAETGGTAAYSLYGDTLGSDGSPADTYIGMERANADAIVRGLSGGGEGCRTAR